MHQKDTQTWIRQIEERARILEIIEKQRQDALTDLGRIIEAARADGYDVTPYNNVEYLVVSRDL